MIDEPTGSVVLDAHALVRLVQGNPRLGSRSRAQIEAAATEVRAFVVANSVWEIATLVAKGRLAQNCEVGAWIDAALALPGLQLAPLDPRLTADATRLPGEMHGDPADRLIVATARQRAATLITDDKLVLQYGVDGQVRTHRAGV